MPDPVASQSVHLRATVRNMCQGFSRVYMKSLWLNTTGNNRVHTNQQAACINICMLYYNGMNNITCEKVSDN